MSTVTLDSVLSSPFPSLDETGAKEQLNAYSEALQHLTSSDVTFTSIPAGAGSGKTRTLTAIISGLIRIGTPPDHIESISFTNASADDFQEKVITALVELSRVPESGIQPSNLGFSTIHKHAIDLLKKLEPHIGGVAYYFEDANESGAVSGDKEIETQLKQKSIRLAFYASIEYDLNGEDLFANLEPFMGNDDLLKRFVMEDMVTGNHRAKAKEFIRRNAMTDAGLGAFTNIDDSNPDFCIAVAVDSLMRLALETSQINPEDRLQRFGLPKFLLVDEGQDLDFLQLLYLRALAVNGVSVVVVGDPRQTLYEFRHSISEWPFQKEFMEALFQGTQVIARMSSSPLLTNYRSRTQIVNLAEEVSACLVEYSETRSDSQYLNPINDPEESVIRSHAFVDRQDRLDKQANAICFIQGGKTLELGYLGKCEAPSKTQVGGALGRVLQRSDEFTKAKPATEKGKRQKLTQIPSLSGGNFQADIESVIHKLYERAKAGESVCILTRNGIVKDDTEYLYQVLKKRLGTSVDIQSTVQFNLLSPEKQAPLSGYWYMGSNFQSYQGVPFSSVLIGAAVNYFMSWDKASTDLIKLKGLKDITDIPLSVTLEEAETNIRRSNPDPIMSIKLELGHYFEAVFIDWQHFFPQSSEEAIQASQDSILDIAARFVLDVLKQYSFGLMKQSRGGIFKRVPCRFQSCTTSYNQERGGMQLRPMNETKRYFKAFWAAITNTAFPFSVEDRQTLENAGIAVEWSEPNTNLLNFPQALSIWREKQELLGSSVNGKTLNRADDFIVARETIHEQFSKIWHHKTRTYLREIAKRVGMLTRQSPDTDSTLILFACFQRKDFHDARNKARVSTYKSISRNKEEYRGLYDDLKKGMRDIKVESAGKKLRLSGEDEANAIPTINLTTIHSSKGLEWDHVLLYFPEPSPQDTESSFKSVRDLLYVAITRARRTLNVVIGKDNFKSPAKSDTAFKIAKHLITTYANDHDLFGAFVQWDLEGEREAVSEDQRSIEVLPQTSHSELEKAMSCRMHHYVQHKRNLSSMVPLTAPSYSFFFHNTLSAICAGLLGHRLSLPEDPIMQMARVIDGLSVKGNLTEMDARRSFSTQCGDAVLTYMQGLVPMYFLSGDDKFFETIAYYTNQFIKQIASILVGSSLFSNLITAKRLGGHQVWIEKPIKDVVRIEVDGVEVYMPVIGIPDMKIAGPKINYVCDYKTVPTVDEDNDEQVRQELVQISVKTHSQINLYQGLKKHPAGNASAEVIYVADITLAEGETVPLDDPIIPSFTGNRDFTVNCALESAIVLGVNNFDQDRFEQTVQEIFALREDSHHNERCPHADLYHATPLVGEDYMEVTQETCKGCGSSIHCQLKVEGV